jgi:hypothetical protein
VRPAPRSPSGFRRCHAPVSMPRDTPARAKIRAPSRPALKWPWEQPITAPKRRASPGPVSHAPPLAAANQLGDRTELVVRRCACEPFNRSVEFDDPFSRRRHHGAAAMLSAGCRGDGRFAQRLIDLFDQDPRPAIGHPQMPRGRRNRPFAPDGFEQCDLARSDAVAAGEVETTRTASAGHRH